MGPKHSHLCNVHEFTLKIETLGVQWVILYDTVVILGHKHDSIDPEHDNESTLCYITTSHFEKYGWKIFFVRLNDGFKTRFSPISKY